MDTKSKCRVNHRFLPCRDVDDSYEDPFNHPRPFPLRMRYVNWKH